VKSVAIVALGCFHPVTKVQSASLHFFLGNDEGSEDSEDESDDDVRFCLHGKISPHSAFDRQLTSNLSSTNVTSRKKTRSDDKKIRKMIKAASKVRLLLPVL